MLILAHANKTFDYTFLLLTVFDQDMWLFTWYYCIFKLLTVINQIQAGAEPEGYNFSYSISDVHYFKLYIPYISNLSHHIKNKLSKLCKKFCTENFNLKLVFNSNKMKYYFWYKDPILKAFVCYILSNFYFSTKW